MPSPMLLPALIPGHRPDLRAGLEAMPSSRLLGLVVVGFGDGVSVIDMPVRPELTFDGRSVQGGLVGTLADYAGVSAAVSALPAGWAASTLSFDVHTLAPARGERLVAIGRVIRVGKTHGVATAEVHAVTGEGTTLVATALVTCRPFEVSR
jgi:uncharacterized protein (TIGR00369 family)